MKHTKSMIYKPTEESRELFVVAINEGRLYRDRIIPVLENMKRYFRKGTFDKARAADQFFYIATAASDQYYKDFGYKFDVTARYTAAVDMVDYYMDAITE